MHRFSFLGSTHIGFIDELYEKYLKHPDSVEPSWRSFFQGYDFARELGDGQIEFDGALSLEEVPEEIRKEFMVIDLINDYRKRGHLFTETNPVRSRRQYKPSLNIAHYGLKEEDLDHSFIAASEVGITAPSTLRTIIEHLQRIYCQSIGIEFVYIRDKEVVNWILNKIHQNDNQPNYNPAQKKRILGKLNEAIAFESFLNTKFVGQKRFSVEGAESLIPALDVLIERASELGVQEVVMGMAHRGRLNVLSNIFGKSPKEIFSEFEGKEFEEDGFDGDVKYHLGYSTEKTLDNGKKIRLNLSPNPSHLEAVDGIVEGLTRARINTNYNSKAGKVLPILIHGDAAVAGQGVVYEVVQMETLDGYKTGGTIHIVINNQVGFTTNYLDGRSSTYCTDIAKVVLAPVLHVNGDDVEAVIHAVTFAAEYRQRYHKNIFIDLLCYRKYGHNEGDEPRFTQPLLYKAISKHPNPRKIYAEKLMQEGLVGTQIVKEMEKDFKSLLQERYDESKKIEHNVITPFMEDQFTHLKTAEDKDFDKSPDTSFAQDDLKFIAEKITTLPDGKKFFNKVVRLLGDRRKMVEEANKLDWGMAELLAYGSLLIDGFNIRISGEDCERGTFSHRHAVIKVEDSEEEYILLNGMRPEQGRMAIYNSHLSEYGVMGFDYGYALASPDTLTIWEAQFGDFANGAQIIIDQFLSAAEDKWRIQNGLVLYLPHGYEGQGAEHSSARLERFLQLCAQKNMQVVNATTPANFYHLLRRQMHRPFRKPLVLMTPKSLLRHPQCVSGIEDLAEGRFQEIITDKDIAVDKVKKVVFCSGKLYYELLEKRTELSANDVAIIRIEQLYPFPEKQFRKELEKFSNAEKIVWSQEEPANMGARAHILLTVRDVNWLDVSAPESAAPASGSHQAALQIQNTLIQQTFEI